MKRRYRNTLKFVESGFRACSKNAHDLVQASSEILKANFHALAAAVAVLAIEELSKLFAIDGLLFARADDEKAKGLSDALKSHATKLTTFTRFPMFLERLACIDPRWQTDEAFRTAFFMSRNTLLYDSEVLLKMLGASSFEELNALKQKALYVSVGSAGFFAPSDAVGADVAKAVHVVARKAMTTLDFLLKSGNLDRYLENARQTRNALSEADHALLEAIAKERFRQLFGQVEEDG